MADARDPDTALRRIHRLAREAAALPQLPDRVRAILAEVERLSERPAGDTPEQSDIPRTDNQSL